MKKDIFVLHRAINTVHAKMVRIAIYKLNDGQIESAKETLLDLVELLEIKVKE